MTFIAHATTSDATKEIQKHAALFTMLVPEENQFNGFMPSKWGAIQSPNPKGCSREAVKKLFEDSEKFEEKVDE